MEEAVCAGNLLPLFMFAFAKEGGGPDQTDSPNTPVGNNLVSRVCAKAPHDGVRRLQQIYHRRLAWLPPNKQKLPRGTRAITVMG
jgi:hypothetical protein